MKHKMWSRLLSMVLAVMMIASIVPSSAFAEAASEIAASSQATSEVQVEEVPLPEDTTTEEPAAETPAEEPAAETPAEEPAGEPAPTAEPVAEPTAEPVTESEQPAAEPTQAPAETAVPSEQPSAEPTAAPEGTETPEGTAVPTETPAPSASPLPSESPVPSETPVPTETPEATEEPVAMNEEAYEATAQVENADITVTVKVPEGALPVDAELKADLIGEETAEFAQVEQALAEDNVEYDGMIALDIRFEVNGEEIEPLYPVEVTIDAKAMLPEDADPETVAVQHLEENENGELTAVKTVADATESAGHVVVEETETEGATMDMVSTFTVEGFSPYAITYGWWPRPTTDWDTINSEDEKIVHFYVNLYSTIANSEAGAGDTEAENFTTSVCQTSIQKHPDYFRYEDTNNGEYIVIQGETDGSAFDVDQDIRSLKDGYIGANKGDEDTPFQLAKFPTDEEIFETIKKDWDGYTKNKGIKINGIAVDQNELTTQKYAIRWYVFKLNDSDFWHIDGILVPRYGQLTVTKTFQNANQILNEIEQDFAISVKGLAGKFEQNYSLRLSKKSSSDQSGVLGYTTKTINENSTTYTWVFDVLDANYTIKETGGDVDQWISSATYSVIKGDQTTASGAYPTNGFSIECDVWGSDEQKETQSVELTNTYEQVLTTLTLTKEFDGLTDEDVYYLLFNQKGGEKEDDQFAFDINYCYDTEVVSSTTNKSEWERIQKIAKKPDGSELEDSGGDFKVYPRNLLNRVTGPDDLENASNQKLRAELKKNDAGNWVYTQVIEVPVCGDGCYYTVFEQHAELPGYAKQGAKSTNWTVVNDSTGEEIYSGVGKAVRKNSESSGDAAIDEEDMLDKKEFQELEIKSPTTVSFTNRYTGNMTIEKEVKDVPAGTADLKDATYTIVIEPAHPEKLMDKEDYGPKFAGKSFTLIQGSKEKTMTFDEHNQAAIKLKAGETVTLKNLPAIQYKITENTNNMAQIGDYVFKSVSVAEIYPDNVSGELEHWNQYNFAEGDEITGKTDLDDRIVAVDVDQSTAPVSSVTVTNLYEKATGTLIIKKTVIGLENDSAALNELKDELSFEISGPEGYATQTIQASDTDKVQWSDAVATITLSKVPVGSYTVTESGYNDVEGYIWQEATIKASDIVVKDATTTLELKNEYTPANGDLLISKTLTGINTTMGDDVTFIFEITGPADSANQKTYYRYLTFSKDDFKTAQDDGSVTKQVWLKDVPVGTYTVKELKAAGYTCNGDDTQSGVVTSSEVTGAQVKFTNNPVADDPTPGDQDFVENRFNWNAETKQWEWKPAKSNDNEKMD